MAVCLIGLGSNSGDRAQHLTRAIERLRSHDDISSVRQSSFHPTDPVGGPVGQQPFLNGASQFETFLSPQDLLLLLQEIEREQGREPAERWGPRTLDLDLLLYDETVCDEPALVLPHPRMGFRRFVLQPATEVGAEMLHPLIGWTVAQLLRHLDTAKAYVAITGAIGSDSAEVARQVSGCCDVVLISDVVDQDVWQLAEDRLRQRAKLLAHANWSTGEDGAVSDFWIGESLAFGRLALPDHDYERLGNLWSEVQPDLVSAKLCVMLEPAPDRSGVESSEQLAQALRDQVTTTHQGPWLRLSAGDLDWAVEETVAAIHAMR